MECVAAVQGFCWFPELSMFLFDIVLSAAVNVQAEINKRQPFLLCKTWKAE